VGDLAGRPADLRSREISAWIRSRSVSNAVARRSRHNRDASRSNQLTLDGGLGIIVGNDSRLEPAVVVDVLKNFDHRFGTQPVPDRVLP
jgi:hypothetical protein